MEQVRQATGAVVVIDVIRAFTTAAYVLAAGAERIVLVDTVAEALAMKAANPDWWAMGHETAGRRPQGFELSNSPVQAARADVAGRTIIQRTGNGTRGVVRARKADRVWCASLVCASATAKAVTDSGLGSPTYVITGDWPARQNSNGDDDRLTAKYIEGVRIGDRVDPTAVATAVAATGEATRTLTIGDGRADPADIEYATRVDAFDFAMVVTREDVGLVLRRSGVG